MSFICRRCDRITKQKLYRVTTEDAGVVLLNVLVCSSCARLAMKLGLPTVKMGSDEKSRKDKTSVGNDGPEATIYSALTVESLRCQRDSTFHASDQ